MITTRQKAKSRDRERKKQAVRRNEKHDALAALRSALRACAEHGVSNSAVIHIVEGYVGAALDIRGPFQAGEVIAYLHEREPLYRIDEIKRLPTGEVRAEMTMIRDYQGVECSCEQLGGPCTLEGAFRASVADPKWA